MVKQYHEHLVEGSRELVRNCNNGKLLTNRPSIVISECLRYTTASRNLNLATVNGKTVPSCNIMRILVFVVRYNRRWGVLDTGFGGLVSGPCDSRAEQLLRRRIPYRR